MKTIKCPTCGNAHALFYQTGKSGKKTLNYLCNRVEKWIPTDFVDNKGNPKTEMVHVTKRQELPFEDGLDIPEKWTASHRKEQQGKKQLQIIMLNQ